MCPVDQTPLEGGLAPLGGVRGVVVRAPTNTATPVLRAGLTEVFVTGMLTRWMRVSPRPIAMGAKPWGARLSVAPRMMSRKNIVNTTSQTSAANSE